MVVWIQEGRTGVIKIDQFDPETVRRLVEFLYTGDYDRLPQEPQPVLEEQTQGPSSLLNHRFCEIASILTNSNAPQEL